MKKTRWEPTFAEVWTRYIPPARPSVAEITLYTRYLRLLQKKKTGKIKLLVLGSTPEFRDWGYEENLDVTVIDYNADNSKVLGSYMRHKENKEHFFELDWKNMQFSNEFDIIVGDHAISVLQKENVKKVLENISNALTDDGFFITKHYLRLKKKERSLENILKDYYKNQSNYGIYQATSTEIVTSQTDPKTDYFNFAKALESLQQLSNQGKLKKEDLKIFYFLNWENMKFDLYAPTKSDWGNLCKKYFKIYKIDYSEDIYAKDMPIYFLKKK
ncbi:MAG: hypothetical protein WC499_04185 [Patescibacteria group bacterium]